MSFSAIVELDNGDSFHVLHDDGSIGGYAVESFLNVLQNFCLDGEPAYDEIRQWFGKLQSISQEPVCRMVQPLLQCIYFGQWDYDEEDYELFLSQSPAMPLSKKEFLNTLRTIEQTWIDLPTLQTALENLISLLAASQLEGNWWYQPQTTEADFLAVAETIRKHSSGSAGKIRIQFI